MTTFIPKTAHKILANPKLQREYFLKPYGLDVSSLPIRYPKIKTTPNNTLHINFLSTRLFCTDQENKLTITY